MALEWNNRLLSDSVHQSCFVWLWNGTTDFCRTECLADFAIRSLPTASSLVVIESAHGSSMRLSTTRSSTTNFPTPCTHHRTPCTHDRAPLYMEPYLLPGASGHSTSMELKTDRPQLASGQSSKVQLRGSITTCDDHSNFRRLLSGLGVSARGTASLRELNLFWGVSMIE